MTAKLLTRAGKGCRTIVPLNQDAFARWRDGLAVSHRRWVRAHDFQGKPGQICPLPDPDGEPRTLAVGLDPDDDLWTYASLPQRVPKGTYRLAPQPRAGEAERAALGWLVGSYDFARYKAVARPPAARLVKPAKADRAKIESLTEGIYLARDLINTPASDMGPAELAAAARGLARRFGARLSVIAGKALLTKNYPMIHAVGRASHREPLLIDLRWGTKGPKVTLVGKGVCFDSGGLDLKSAGNMMLMKKDMGGGAHVLGLALAIMATKLPLRLRVLVPAVENAVSGDAFRPLDVLTSRKGLSVEIGNTDAEGRLVLADALTEASREKPDLILDFATLTGAARVALGSDLPALFCNRDDLATRLLAHGRDARDPLWRMPLHQPYRRLLDSKVADINNISSGPFGGAITAALFLQEFVAPEIAWAHIDLMAWNSAARPGRPEGGLDLGLRAAYALLAEMAKRPAAKGRR
jgi:leucyl aminopeptidase